MGDTEILKLIFRIANTLLEHSDQSASTAARDADFSLPAFIEPLFFARFPLDATSTTPDLSLLSRVLDYRSHLH